MGAARKMGGCCNRSFRWRGLAVGFVFVALVASSGAVEEITEPVDSARLHRLVGKEVKVTGKYVENIFERPAIVIRGEVFYLLENPPSKRTYNFPKGSGQGTVQGILYFYDHSQFQMAAYREIGDQFFFFNIDQARLQVELEEEPVARTRPEPKEGDRMAPYMGSWKLLPDLSKLEERAEGNPEAESFVKQLEQELERVVITITPDQLIGPPGEDGNRDIRDYSVIYVSESMARVRAFNPVAEQQMVQEWRILDNGRLEITSIEGNNPGNKLLFEPW